MPIQGLPRDAKFLAQVADLGVTSENGIYGTL